MPKLLYLLLYAITISATAQQRGGEVSSNKNDTSTVSGISYAVIVGVSNYKYIKSLDFADQDALLFMDFLQSKAGGNLKDENIKLILNEEAVPTTFPIIKTWLEIKKPVKGDRVYLYFAGHGDAIDKEDYFFLLNETNPANDKNNYYGGMSGALDMNSLKRKIKTLTDVGVEVLLIWDACRTNEMVGGQEAIKSLQQGIAERNYGELLMMASSAGQASLESDRFGHGHGLFSYYLIEGLSGAADKKEQNGNGDGKVDISELDTWVKIKVKKGADSLFKSNQVPKFIYNNSDTRISIANNQFAFLLAMKKHDSNLIALNKPVKLRSANIALVDTVVAALYNNCMLYIKEDNGEGTDKAEKVLAVLQEKYPDNSLTKEAGLNLAMEYINLTQEKINLYLNGKDDVKEFDSTENGRLTKSVIKTAATTNAQNAVFIDKALKLFLHFGFDDSTYLQQLEARYNFFMARSYHMKEGVVKTSAEAFAYARKSLAVNKKAAFNYHLIALLFAGNKAYDSAIKYDKIAHQLAPNWTYVLKGLANYYQKKYMYDSAIHYLSMILVSDPEYAYSYDAFFVYLDLGDIFYGTKSFKSAVRYYNKALEIETGYARPFYHIGNVFKLEKQYDSAVWYYKKAIEKEPMFIEPYNNLGNTYVNKNMYDSAVEMYSKTIQIDSLYQKGFANLGYVYYVQHQYPQSILNYKKAVTLAPSDANTLYNLASVYVLSKEPENGLIYLEMAIKKGYTDKQQLIRDQDLNGIRETEKFKTLLSNIK